MNNDFREEITKPLRIFMICCNSFVIFYFTIVVEQIYLDSVETVY